MQTGAAFNRPLFLKRISALLAIALTVGLVSFVTQRTEAHAAAASFNKTSIVEAKDFASAAWHDPWDFSNPSDLRQDGGSTGNIANVSMKSSVLSYTAGRSSWISLLWGGYPGSIRMGRDGALVSNQINATTFSRIHLHLYSPRQMPAAINYFTQDGYKGMGGVAFLLRPGWNDYDLALKNNMPGLAAYTGRIQGLRLSTSASPAANIRVDFVRVYEPTTAQTVRFSSPTGQLTHLFWSSTSASPTTHTATSGEVAVASVSAGSTAGAPLVNLGGFPPGTRFYAVQTSNHAVVGPALKITPRPNVIIDSPTAAGCGDWATSALGHPWKFTSRGQLAGLGNATGVNFNGGVLTATNGGPTRNDPWVSLPTGKGINGAVWNRLTIVEGYDGPFNLSGSPGGGTMARLHWSLAGHAGLSQTNDLVTYAGKRTITLNLGMPASQLTEPESAIRYPFASAAPVTSFRWDPNEDPGARRWHLYSVTLGRDCATTSGFFVKWHDTGFTPGAKATLSVSLNGRSYNIGTVAEKAGLNGIVVRNNAVPKGAYRVTVTAQNSGASAATSADSPLVITR
ncbi:MAG: hypothetical protein JWO63_189 [Frankiales bacterium]|nr:hypothetical protein [Frankiales bacterium]